jgi:hypothetical protein
MQSVYGPVLAYHIFAEPGTLVDAQNAGDATRNTANRAPDRAANRSPGSSAYVAACFSAARRAAWNALRLRRKR